MSRLLTLCPTVVRFSCSQADEACLAKLVFVLSHDLCGQVIICPEASGVRIFGGVRMAKIAQVPLPPYVAYSTWKKLLRDLGQNVPARLDSSYYDGLKLSGSTRSSLKSALVYLGLCTREGDPTDMLQQLVKLEGEARKSMLQAITKQAYGNLFTKLDLNRATSAQLKEHFKNLGMSKDIGRKCMSFFLAIADDSGIRLSPHLREAIPGTRGKKATTKTSPRKGDGLAVPFETPNYLAPLLINKFPNFDPAWPQDTKHKWFDDFIHLVNKLCGTNQLQPPAL